MAAWRFHDYVTPADDEKPSCNLMQEWYAAQNPAVRALFDVTVGLLRATPDWNRSKSFSALKHDHVGLGELRFKVEEKGRPVRRFRPVGAWPTVKPREFVLILGCEKGMNGILNPRNAFDLALKYKRLMDSGKGYTHERT